jgi:hypothetical protein
MNQFPTAPEYTNGAVSNFYIQNFSLSPVSINDIVEKLFTGVHDIGDKLLAVSLLTVINYWWCRC